MTQKEARALVEAGYMPLDRYLELAKQHCWKAATEQSSNLAATPAIGEGSLAARQDSDSNSSSRIKE